MRRYSGIFTSRSGFQPLGCMLTAMEGGNAGFAWSKNLSLCNSRYKMYESLHTHARNFLNNKIMVLVNIGRV